MKMRYLKDVVSLELSTETCVGCGQCLEVCPHGVFELADGKCRIADRDACMECGACARNCPVKALKVKNGVGCATGILNAALGRSSGCCGEKQACCSGEDECESETEEKGGTMDARTRELIAIGASVAAHCQPCLAYHAEKGKEAGLTESEIREAISVGQMVEKGSADAMKEFAAGIFAAEAKSQKTPDCCKSSTPAGKSCCS